MENALIDKAREVLKQNDRGTHTVPAEDLYPHQWLWDSCFIAIGLRHVNIERAQTELESLLRGQWSNGMLPDMIFNEGALGIDHLLWDSAMSPYSPRSHATSGITQPPMLAEAVLKVGKKLPVHERRAWFKTMLPRIVLFHEWLYRERDPHHEGLITLIHPYESGLDNSPPWVEELYRRGIPWWAKLSGKFRLEFLVNILRRDIRYSSASQRMSNVEALSFFAALRRLRRKGYDSEKILERPYLAVQELLFNCIFIRANSALSEIAKVAGEKLPQALENNINKSEKALETLWDEQTGIYYSRSYTSGELIIEPTIAALMPLYAGCIDAERAERLVQLLHKRQYFKANWPVPSVPVNSHYFNPIRYWQGPTWVNTNWLIIEGLHRYGFSEEADALSKRTLELVDKNGFAEYFNPINGEPHGAGKFSWSAALAIDLLKD